MKERAAERTESFRMPNGADVRAAGRDAEVMACGGGTQQMEEEA